MAIDPPPHAPITAEECLWYEDSRKLVLECHRPSEGPKKSGASSHLFPARHNTEATVTRTRHTILDEDPETDAIIRNYCDSFDSADEELSQRSTPVLENVGEPGGLVDREIVEYLYEPRLVSSSQSRSQQC